MKMTSVSKRLRRSAWAVIVAGALAGCATPQPPAEKISLARDSVGRALAAQATQYAPLEMKTAQDKLARMEQAIGEKITSRSTPWPIRSKPMPAWPKPRPLRCVNNRS